MNDMDVVHVAPGNGKADRVVVAVVSGVHHRGQFNPNSDVCRARFIRGLAQKLGTDPAELWWLDTEICDKADEADALAEREAGEILDDEAGAGAKPSTAQLLVELALQRYRIGRSELDEPFAVPIEGPNVALMLRGSKDALRASLARDFYAAHGRIANASALVDALTVIQGQAMQAPPERLWLRTAAYEDKVVVDLGDETGRAIVVRPGYWEMVDKSPVLFRRTALTGALPVPRHGGDIRALQSLLNVSPATWPLLLGWEVASLLPDIPHPILLLGGEQGTGKSTAARMLGGLVDQSPAPLRSQPSEPEAWAMAAAGSWLVVVDNVSQISEWWSDSLCKAVTGDGWVRRKLYSDGDLAVLAFRRVVALTSIDAGALRGDLGDRVVLADLQCIPDHCRRAEAELDAWYQEQRPLLLGALLDILAGVLEKLPQVTLPSLPRMADFGRVLGALDLLLLPDVAHGVFLNTYLGQRERIATEVVEHDVFATAVIKLVEDHGGVWQGTATELLDAMVQERPPKGWPKGPQVVSGRLKRLAPAFRGMGFDISFHREGRQRAKTWSIRKDG